MRKSILCFLLSVVLLFNTGYKAHVEALSLVVIGSITLGEALLYCACVVGTTVAVVETEKHFQEQQMETLQNSDVYEPYGEEMLQDFKTWCSNCPQYVDVKTREIEDWLANVVEGTLDKGCEVWQAFKDYIVSVNDTQKAMTSSNTGTQVVDVSSVQINDAFSKISQNDVLNANVNLSTVSYPLDNRIYGVDSDYSIANDGQSVSVCIQYSDMSSELVVVSNAYAGSPNLFGSYGLGFSYAERTYARDINYNSVIVDNCPSYGGCRLFSKGSGVFENTNYLIRLDVDISDLYYMFPNVTYRQISKLILASGVINGYWDFSIPVPDWGIADDVVIDKNVQDVIERDGTLDNVDVWGYSDMTLDKDDVISVDWDNVTVGDIAKPYVGGQTLAIDMVDGIDVNTDTLIEDIPVLPVAIRDSYTIPKLETVFPFCIPFDLVKIFTLFKAEPDAPHFTWTFYFGIGELKPYIIEIDLDPFNSVAEIVRLLELIGFLVFLTLKTRDLIRG